MWDKGLVNKCLGASDPEPTCNLSNERAVTGLKFTEGLGQIEPGNKVSEDSGLNQQRATKIRQGIMGMLACYENILKEKKKSLSRQTSMLDFYKSPSGTCASPSVLLVIGGDGPDDLSQVKKNVPPP
jgi:hypothetical protein